MELAIIFIAASFIRSFIKGDVKPEKQKGNQR